MKWLRGACPVGLAPLKHDPGGPREPRRHSNSRLVHPNTLHELLRPTSKRVVMPMRVVDDRTGAMHELAAKVAIATLGDLNATYRAASSS